MQNAKDTFYLALQSRLATLNPARTTVIRGVLRPGILVVENEMPSAWVPLDAFRLEWDALQIDAGAPLPLINLACSIRYATDGGTANAGMDRGRLLEAMDFELACALATAPHSAAKMNYSATAPGIPPSAMGSNVFWIDPVFSPAIALDGRLERTATVQVFAYQEAGEL